jgi:hypothetical protein
MKGKCLNEYGGECLKGDEKEKKEERSLKGYCHEIETG